MRFTGNILQKKENRSLIDWTVRRQCHFRLQWRATSHTHTHRHTYTHARSSFVMFYVPLFADIRYRDVDSRCRQRHTELLVIPYIWLKLRNKWNWISTDCECHGKVFRSARCLYDSSCCVHSSCPASGECGIFEFSIFMLHLRRSQHPLTSFVESLAVVRATFSFLFVLPRWLRRKFRDARACVCVCLFIGIPFRIHSNVFRVSCQ